MSIKQLLLNMSTEARQEVREILDWIEGNTLAVPKTEAQVEQAEDTQKELTEQSSETKKTDAIPVAPSGDVNAPPAA